MESMFYEVHEVTIDVQICDEHGLLNAVVYEGVDFHCENVITAGFDDMDQLEGWVSACLDLDGPIEWERHCREVHEQQIAVDRLLNEDSRRVQLNRLMSAAVAFGHGATSFSCWPTEMSAPVNLQTGACMPLYTKERR